MTKASFIRIYFVDAVLLKMVSREDQFRGLERFFQNADPQAREEIVCTGRGKINLLNSLIIW